MANFKVQLVPGLLTLTTNVPKINCFSFWDYYPYKDFFALDENSRWKVNYFVKDDVATLYGSPSLRFSYLNYLGEKWYYHKKVGPIDFKFTIDEETNTIAANHFYNRVFIKLGRLEPIGDIITDYLTNLLEKAHISYHYGSAASYRGKSYLFFGFGRNFKTSLVNLILDGGGSYIGEEFFLLEGDRVYATLPNVHAFDLRASHQEIIKRGLNMRRLDVSEYRAAIFLLHSDRDHIEEIGREEANKNTWAYQNVFNTYYYRFFKAKDHYLGVGTGFVDQPLKNEEARYFVVRFTDVRNVFEFIKGL